MTASLPTAHETVIRSELLRTLAAEFADDSTTLLLDEFGILEGRNRVDLAAVNGALHGYEIKSERDTLTRLGAQAQAYARVFDYVTLVATSRHLEAARPRLPDWWGLARAEPSGDRVEICQVRKARRNSSVDPTAIVQLLWREEAVEILHDLGVRRGVSSKPRRIVWQRLIEAIDSTEILRLYVRETIKGRSDWRTSTPAPAAP